LITIIIFHCIKRKFNVDIKFDFNDQSLIQFIQTNIKNNPFLTKKK